MRYTPSGDAIAKFSIAVSWKTKDKEGTDWVPLAAYGKLAEVCGKHLSTGSRVRVTASYSTRKYEKGGKTIYAHEFKCAEVEFLSGSREAKAPDPDNDGPAEPPIGDDIPF
jgi:single-strand DNA-binding protein